MAGTRTITAEPPRSTAYYYADLERLKRKNGCQDSPNSAEESNPNQNEQSDYVESNEVVDEGPVAEVPPLRDRRECQDPPRPNPDRKLEETYSTAGTFPMPEPKEKEPLLAELEVVGRLPLTQLDSGSGVRRSRSWYLCCPNVGEEEISRESSWRYSSLRPVTAPPAPGQNGIHLVATQSSGQEDVVTLRNERDALARALAAEKQKAASAARAHDARLAELHGVIAELVRRRAQDKSARAIPEEEVSDECESTTQPAGELDNDADRSRTEQNDTSSLSPAELPSPLEAKPELKELPDDTTDTSTQEMHVRVEQPRVEVTTPQQSDPCDTSVNYSERDSEICVSTARCCQYARAAHLLGDSYEVPEGLLPPSPGRCESRQAKLASRVRLRRTEETDSSNHLSTEETRVNVIEESALRLHDEEDLLALDPHDGGDFVEGGVCGARCAWWRARCRRLQADCRLLDCALARALHTAHRLTCACAAQESSCVALCSALRAADRALETYDVLLALAETQHRQCSPEREAAELVALQLLARLEAGPTLPEPLLSPGPWLPPNHHHHQDTPDCGYSASVGSGAVPRSGWSAALEARLRRQAARLKADTVALRAHNPKPRLFSRHDAEEEDSGGALADVGVPEMEAAVALQEAMAIREKKALERMMRVRPDAAPTDSCRSRRRKERERHWLESHASETDL